MDNSTKQTVQSGSFEKVMNAMADYISSDVAVAKEFLREEGVDVDAQTKNNMAFIERIQQEARQRLAVKA